MVTVGKLRAMLEGVPDGVRVNLTVLPCKDKDEAQDHTCVDASYDAVCEVFDLFGDP